jgi:hypothetical protein
MIGSGVILFPDFGPGFGPALKVAIMYAGEVYVSLPLRALKARNEGKDDDIECSPPCQHH